MWWLEMNWGNIRKLGIHRDTHLGYIRVLISMLKRLDWKWLLLVCLLPQLSIISIKQMLEKQCIFQSTFIPGIFAQIPSYMIQVLMGQCGCTRNSNLKENIGCYIIQETPMVQCQLWVPRKILKTLDSILQLSGDHIG